MNLLESASSNVQMNKIYERHIPPSWHKIDYMTSVGARKHWIRAKYSSGLFTIPPLPFVSMESQVSLPEGGKVDPSVFIVNPMNDLPGAQSMKVLPARIVDYFINIGGMFPYFTSIFLSLL